MAAVTVRPVAPGDGNEAALAGVIRDTLMELGTACYDANPDHLLAAGAANGG